MLLTASFMAFATFISKVLGLVRDSLMGAYFGAGIEADAFMAASKLPTTLFDMVIGGVISASFIPVFNSILTKKGKDEAKGFANKFITMIILVTLIISVVGILFAEPLVRFMAPNFGAEAHDLAVKLTSIMFPMIIFTGIAFSFVGILQSYGEYNIPAIISLVSNTALIVYFILFGKRFGVTGLAVTMVIAWSLQVIVQIPSLIRLKFKYKPDFHLRDSSIKEAVVFAIPMLVSTWVQPFYTLINARFASHMEGAYSSLEYANRLYLIVTGVFSFVVTNLIFPKLARANASDDKKEANELVAISIKSIVMVIAPLMAGIVILAKPITSIIYGHGELASHSGVVATALACYATGMVFLALNEVLSKTFFSMKKSVTPMITSLVSMLFNIILVMTIYPFIKGDIVRLTGGLAIAAAGGSIVNALLNGAMLFRLSEGFINRDGVITILKSLAAAAVMAAVVRIVYMFIGTADTFMGSIITCVVCGIVGVAIYAIMLVLLRVKEIMGFIPKRKR
ncbi:MAG: murein biosynthesis integral membrane protein MurJ [Clostridia bacterium]|nr:murein biosynthesis integral membrane protein MurJ [Clostridia bacterium]